MTRTISWDIIRKYINPFDIKYPQTFSRTFSHEGHKYVTGM